MKKRILSTAILFVLALIAMTLFAACTANKNKLELAETEIIIGTYEEYEIKLASGQPVGEATYEISDESVVKVDKGRIVAQGKVGSANVEVKKENRKATIAVTVSRFGNPYLKMDETVLYADVATELPVFVSYRDQKYAMPEIYEVTVSDTALASANGKIVMGIDGEGTDPTDPSLIGKTDITVRATYKGLNLETTFEDIAVRKNSFIGAEGDGTVAGADLILYALDWDGKGIDLSSTELKLWAVKNGICQESPQFVVNILEGSENINVEGLKIQALRAGSARLRITCGTLARELGVTIKPNYIESDFAIHYGAERGGVYEIYSGEETFLVGRVGVKKYTTGEIGESFWNNRMEMPERNADVLELYRNGYRYFAFDLYYTTTRMTPAPLYLGQAYVETMSDVAIGEIFNRKDVCIVQDGQITNRPKTNAWITIVYDIGYSIEQNPQIDSLYCFTINDEDATCYIDNVRYYLDDAFLPEGMGQYAEGDEYIQANNREFVEFFSNESVHNVYEPTTDPVDGVLGAYRYVSGAPDTWNSALVLYSSLGVDYARGMASLLEKGNFLTFDLYLDTAISFFISLNHEMERQTIVAKEGGTNLADIPWLRAINRNGRQVFELSVGEWYTLVVDYASLLDSGNPDLFKTTILFACEEQGETLYLNNVRYYANDDFVPNEYEGEEPESLADAYQNEIETTIEKLGEVVTEGSVNYLFITDLHAGHNDESVRRELEAVTEIVEQLNGNAIAKDDIDFICLGGDLTDGWYVDRNEMFADIDKMLEPLNTLSVPVLVLRGNHDDNSYYYWGQEGVADSLKEQGDTAVQSYIAQHFVSTELWNSSVLKVYSPEDIVHDSLNENSAYYFYDLTDKNTRVICLDSIDYGEINDKNYGATYWGYSLAQMDWLLREGLTAPADWNYIFLSHMGYDSSILYEGTSGYSMYQYLNLLEDILTAYQNRMDYDSGIQYRNTAGQMVRLAQNFSNRTGWILTYEFGHHHADYNIFNDRTGIATMTIGTAGSFSSIEGNSHVTIGQGQADVYERIAGRLSEACFDLVSATVERVEQIRFGVGENRSFQLTGPNAEKAYVGLLGTALNGAQISYDTGLNAIKYVNGIGHDKYDTDNGAVVFGAIKDKSFFNGETSVIRFDFRVEQDVDFIRLHAAMSGSYSSSWAHFLYTENEETEISWTKNLYLIDDAGKLVIGNLKVDKWYTIYIPFDYQVDVEKMYPYFILNAVNRDSEGIATMYLKNVEFLASVPEDVKEAVEQRVEKSGRLQPHSSSSALVSFDFETENYIYRNQSDQGKWDTNGAVRFSALADGSFFDGVNRFIKFEMMLDSGVDMIRVESSDGRHWYYLGDSGSTEWTETMYVFTESGHSIGDNLQPGEWYTFYIRYDEGNANSYYVINVIDLEGNAISYIRNIEYVTEVPQDLLDARADGLEESKKLTVTTDSQGALTQGKLSFDYATHTFTFRNQVDGTNYWDVNTSVSFADVANGTFPTGRKYIAVDFSVLSGADILHVVNTSAWNKYLYFESYTGTASTDWTDFCVVKQGTSQAVSGKLQSGTWYTMYIPFENAQDKPWQLINVVDLDEAHDATMYLRNITYLEELPTTLQLLQNFTLRVNGSNNLNAEITIVEDAGETILRYIDSSGNMWTGGLGFSKIGTSGAHYTNYVAFRFDIKLGSNVKNIQTLFNGSQGENRTKDVATGSWNNSNSLINIFDAKGVVVTDAPLIAGEWYTFVWRTPSITLWNEPWISLGRTATDMPAEAFFRNFMQLTTEDFTPYEEASTLLQDFTFRVSTDNEYAGTGSVTAIRDENSYVIRYTENGQYQQYIAGLGFSDVWNDSDYFDTYEAVRFEMKLVEGVKAVYFSYTSNVTSKKSDGSWSATNNLVKIFDSTGAEVTDQVLKEGVWYTIEWQTPNIKLYNAWITLHSGNTETNAEAYFRNLEYVTKTQEL